MDSPARLRINHPARPGVTSDSRSAMISRSFSLKGSWPESILARAYHFAAVRHVDQRRKGEAVEPYVNHLTDPEIIVAAVLHDTVEDTPTTLAAARGVGRDRFGRLDHAGVRDPTRGRAVRAHLHLRSSFVLSPPPAGSQG